MAGDPAAAQEALVERAVVDPAQAALPVVVLAVALEVLAVALEVLAEQAVVAQVVEPVVDQAAAHPAVRLPVVRNSTRPSAKQRYYRARPKRALISTSCCVLGCWPTPR